MLPKQIASQLWRYAGAAAARCGAGSMSSEPPREAKAAIDLACVEQD
jgi:hypothetical protein